MMGPPEQVSSTLLPDCHAVRSS